MARVGILGGGQLARMLGYAALQMGLTVDILDPQPSPPAAVLARRTSVARWDDAAALRAFAASCDVLTFENEFVDCPALETIPTSTPVRPGPAYLGRLQDKGTQKTLLAEAGFEVAPFACIQSAAEVFAFAAEHGYPLLLKARVGGYDGYGNRRVNAPDEVPGAMTSLGFPERRPSLLVEAFVAFARELAVLAVRNPRGEVRVYPTVETVQREHVCLLVRAPAPIAPELSAAAQDIARRVIETLEGIGVLAVELFHCPNLGRPSLGRPSGRRPSDNPSTEAPARLLINELAPRVHNSGHYSIEACHTSQFANHLRAILDWPLGACEMIPKAAVMRNLLGQQQKPAAAIEGIPRALAVPGVQLHLYGKTQVRPRRKMGHLTVLGDDLAQCEALAEEAAACIDL